MNKITLNQCDYRIYVGCKERNTDIVHDITEVLSICQEYVDNKGECVFVKKGTYVYTNGREDGVEVLFIQYPRFPKKEQEIKNRAVELGKVLAKKLNQLRVMVIGNGESTMITNTKLKNQWIDC